MTLLQTYIEHRIKAFREPERRGTQKGHEIGVYRGRHDAALYSLYDYDQKEIAQLSKISHAFLRKLRTEERFMQLIECFKEEYVSRYIVYYISGNYVPLSCNEVHGDLDDNYKKCPYTMRSALCDVADYSESLRRMIADSIVNKFNKRYLDFFLTDNNRLIYMLSKWNDKDLNKKIFLELLIPANELIRNTLNAEDITEDMKIEGLMSSRLIRRLAATI